MKFRCTHNSIRLRLRKSEVRELKQKARIIEHILFSPEQQLIITLSIDDKIAQIGACFVKNNIAVSLPKDMAEDWINSDNISLEAVLNPHSTKPALHILVEKDLSCKDREDEKSDYFDKLESKVC